MNVCLVDMASKVKYLGKCTHFVLKYICIYACLMTAKSSAFIVWSVHAINAFFSLSHYWNMFMFNFHHHNSLGGIHFHEMWLVSVFDFIVMIWNRPFKSAGSVAREMIYFNIQICLSITDALSIKKIDIISEIQKYIYILTSRKKHHRFGFAPNQAF